MSSPHRRFARICKPSSDKVAASIAHAAASEASAKRATAPLEEPRCVALKTRPPSTKPKLSLLNLLERNALHSHCYLQVHPFLWMIETLNAYIQF